MRYTISILMATALASPAFAEVPRVVTDFLPTHALVSMVMGDLGQPEMLMEKGGNAHDFQLRPSQAAALADAGLVIWAGPQMSPWLDRTLDGLGDVPQLRLLDAPGTELREFGATHDDHDHAEGKEVHGDHAEAEAGHEGHGHAAPEAAHEGHDHADPDAGHDDHAEAGHEDHAHEGIDPHAWLDPHNAAHWLTVIAEALAARDPEHAAIYAANAAAGAERIAALDSELAAQLTPVQGKPFVVFHDAYGYFTAHYGLTVAGSVALGDATAPGAARLRALQDKAGAEALCLFPEAGHDPKLVAQMAEATGVKLGAPLDPEGAAIDPGPDAYATLLRNLATNLADCLN